MRAIPPPVRCLVLLAALAACSSEKRADPGQRSDPAAATTGYGGARPRDREDGDGAGRHPDAARVAATCARAAESARDADPAERIRLLIHGCKHLFFEPGCYQAWDRAETAPPSQRIGIIIDGCRAAYCPILPAPRPRACEENSSSPTLFHELQQAIFELELGKVTADRLVAAMTRTAMDAPALPYRTVQTPPRAPPPAEIVIDGDGVHYDVLRLSADDLAPGSPGADLLRRALEAARADGLDALGITADASQPYRLVVEVMDIAKQAGITKLMMKTTP